MKWIKRILTGIVILVLLFVITAVVLIATVDPNAYKPGIESAVQQATGRELALKGDIELSLFPWLGLKLGPARLGNAEGFGPEPFTRVENVQVRVAVLPLFRGEVRADTVKLDGLRVNLSQNAQGKTNWEDLLKDRGKQAPPQATEQPGRDLVLAVGGIEIEDAALHWRDAQSGTDARIAPINLSTGALTFGDPFDFDLALHLASARPAAEADVDLSGEAMINPETQHYRLADSRLTVNATGAELPEGGVNATLETAIDADLKAGTVTVQPLTLKTANLQLAGHARATSLNSAPQVQGELTSDAFNPRKWLAVLGQKLPPTRDPGVMENAIFKLAFSATPDSAKLSRLEAQLDDTHLTGQAAVDGFDDPKITVVAALDEIDLDRYRPPEEAQPAPTEKPAPPGDDNLDLPVEALRDLHLDGRLNVGKLKATELNFTDLDAAITARDGALKVSPLSMNLYQGGLKSAATLDVRGDTPKFAMNSVLDGVQAGGVVTELFGDDYLTGTARLTLDLHTQGQQVLTLKQALSGDLAVSFTEGSIANSQLAQRIARVVAFFTGRPEAPTPAEIRFTRLMGNARITRGVLVNDNLALVSPQILARGQGKVNIPQSSVDYTLKVALNDEGKPKENRFVPIEITGEFSDLDYTLALTDVIKEEAEQAVKQELQEKEQALKEKVQEKLGEELKDLKDQFGF